jgi:hypothetical protein
MGMANNSTMTRTDEIAYVAGGHFRSYAFA